MRIEEMVPSRALRLNFIELLTAQLSQSVTFRIPSAPWLQ